MSHAETFVIPKKSYDILVFCMHVILDSIRTETFQVGYLVNGEYPNALAILDFQMKYLPRYLCHFYETSHSRSCSYRSGAFLLLFNLEIQKFPSSPRCILFLLIVFLMIRLDPPGHLPSSVANLLTSSKQAEPPSLSPRHFPQSVLLAALPPRRPSSTVSLSPFSYTRTGTQTATRHVPSSSLGDLGREDPS